jgi:hypothetical protein|tara:strand:+ start:577 stop:759 length:183 start_codon:yes stop_codon:yes gene_type:complete
MLRNNVIDEVNEEYEQDSQHEKIGQSIKWYLIDSEGTFCFIWNFCITILTIYTLIISPFM